MAEFLLRPLTRADLPAAAELERACFSHPWTEGQLAADLENDLLTPPGGLFPRGFPAGLGRGARHPGRGHPGAHRRGPPIPPAGGGGGPAAPPDGGRKRTGWPFLTLEVRAGNAPAIGLYEKLGFQAVGRRKNYYREEGEDALLMTAYLHPPAE